MGSRKKGRFCRATRAETTKNLIYGTENMAFKDFANYRKKRNRTIVRGRRGFRLGNRDNIIVFSVRWKDTRRNGLVKDDSKRGSNGRGRKFKHTIRNTIRTSGSVGSEIKEKVKMILLAALLPGRTLRELHEL